MPQPALKVQRRSAGQLQHHVDRLQPLRVRERLGAGDQIALQPEVGHAVSQLAEHGFHAALGYDQIAAAKPLPRQNQELVPPHAAQLPYRLQDISLLDG